MIPKHCVLGLLWQGIHPFVPSRSRPPLVTLEMKPANKSALKHFAFAASMILSRYFSRIDTWLAAICCEHWTHSSRRAFSSMLQVVPQVTPWSFAVSDERPKWDDVSIQESNVLSGDDFIVRTQGIQSKFTEKGPMISCLWYHVMRPWRPFPNSGTVKMTIWFGMRQW